MTLLALTAVVLLGFAAYYLACAFADIPTARTSRAMLMVRRQQGVKREILAEVYLTKIAGLLAPLLKLDRLKRNKLQSALHIAGVELTPEVYTAKAWVTAGAAGLCSLPMAFVMPLMVPLLVGLAVALWFSTYYAVFDYVRKRRKLIEAEIPRFALTIGQNLENDRDVLKILTSYRRVAGRDYGAELDQTIADMITSNYENALLHFETRIGSPMLSDVVRGLVGVLRGDDQRMYFKMICFDMRQIEQNNLKKEAAQEDTEVLHDDAYLHYDYLSCGPVYRGVKLSRCLFRLTEPHRFPSRQLYGVNNNTQLLYSGGFTMKKIFIKFNSTAARLMLNTRAALSNQRGDFYISDAVKIIIAVVLGALLLAALTLIFNDTVIPRITREIEALFG